MVKLMIIGNPSEAARALRTNRPLRVGQTIEAWDDVAAHQLLASCPDLFTTADDGCDTSKHVNVDRNKMLAKGKRFKSK